MELFVTLFIASLFNNIFFNYFLICILPHRVNIITVTPKLPSPQLLFHFWMKSEKFSCRNTFHYLNYIFCGHHRYALYQKMNMVFICADLQKMYFKSSFNISTNFYQTFCNSFRQNTSPIFYRTDQMIQQQTFIMPL